LVCFLSSGQMNHLPINQGLTMGSIPFLLQSKASYTEIGIFSLASYPYSLKLLWSPIVDAVYSDSKSPINAFLS